jgi:heme A synthase
VATLGSDVQRRPSARRFAAYAWALLGYNLLIIIWGALVRATGSGAGCGNHWPLCNGEIVPRAPQLETVIEFSHRVTSGIALFGVVALLIWAWRAYPRRHRVRRAAAVSMFFMLTEALIGAGLVLFEYVAHNVSIARAYWMAGHLINTFFLLAALALTAWWASGKQPGRLRGQARLTVPFALAFVGVLILGASGGVTALGDTLVLGAGISPEESPVVAELVALRIYHPLIAFLVGGLVAFAAWSAHARRPTADVRRFTYALAVLYVVQLLAGALNVALKAPVWLQMTHLLISNLIWIALVLLAASALAVAGELAVDAAADAAVVPPPSAASSAV